MEMDGASSTADSAPNSGGSPKNSPGGEQGVDFSGTNNQEQGVDEADFVKTDGSYVYMLNKGYSDYGIYPSGKLHILDIPEVGNISYLSNISIEGRPTEMLLVDDKAVRLDLPASVEATVIEAPDAIRGDTAGNVQKPVTISSGITVMVPLFIKKDDVIKISTDDRSYQGRV